MKLLNFLLLNLNLNFIKSNFLEKNLHHESLFGSERDSHLTRDSVDSILDENVAIDNSNSIQTYHHNQFINTPPQNQISNGFNFINLGNRIRIGHDHQPTLFISPILPNHQLEPINTQETHSSTNAHYPPNSVSTRKRKVSTSQINSNNGVKRPRKKSQSNRPKMKSSEYRSPADRRYSKYKFHLNWIYFEPKEIGEIIAIKSINALELVDGTPFFHLHQFKNKSKDLTNMRQMYCLDISHVMYSQEFFTFFWGMRSKPYLNDEKIDQETTHLPDEKILQETNHLPDRKIIQKINLMKKQSVWNQLVNSQDEVKFLDYKKFVLSDFSEKIADLDQSITDHLELQNYQKRVKKSRATKTQVDMKLELSYRIPEKRKDRRGQTSHSLKQFPRAKKMFPLFLLHVDLINIVLPAKNSDKEVTTLRRQRNIAGDEYLQLTAYLIGLKNDVEMLKRISTGKFDLAPLLKERTLFPSSQDKGSEFLWHMLHYWMVNKREDILKIAAPVKSISIQFRHFFTQLIESWYLSPP